MDIKGKVAVITGAASGIGRAAAAELYKQGVSGLALVDVSEAVVEVANSLNAEHGGKVARAFRGDTTDATFRHEVFETMRHQFGPINICVPAAGITRDALAVKMNKEKGKANLYPIEHFRLVMEVNLVAPVYWALEMVAQLAEDRFVGQISYATTKVGLEGAASTLMKEAIYYGVRCAVLHPGFTDTPMVRALGEDYIQTQVLPATQIKRLIRPEEIADAISFLIRNSAVSGQLWADAGWHPMPT
jgi:3-oxoacyl-[acyl-carrier protein] reductase